MHSLVAVNFSSKYRSVGVIACAALIASGWFTRAHAYSAEDVLTAEAGVYSADVVSQTMAEYCSQNAPAKFPAVQQAFLAWQKKYDTVSIRQRLEQKLPAAKRRNFGLTSEQKSQLHQKLASRGSADQFCQALPAQWQGESMDLSRNFPLAYNQQAAKVPYTELYRPSPSGKESPVYSGQAVGTVYNLAQIETLAQPLMTSTATDDEKLNRMGLTGQVYVTGKVINQNDKYYLAYDDGTFRSSLLANLSFDLAAYEGKTITATGTVDRFPKYLLFLRDAKLVTDTYGLKPSTLSMNKGLARKEVTSNDVTVIAGNGLSEEDIEATFYYYEYSGTVNKGKSMILLKDGTMYDRADIAPAILDVEKSKKAEPQHWHKWKKSGNSISYLGNDQAGNPTGKWINQEGEIWHGWDNNTRLNGTYIAKSFSGTAAFAGTYREQTITFGSDGRFEETNFSNTSSGSMAAMNGFSANSSSYSDTSGTSSSGGGGTSSFYTVSKSHKDNGADKRGSYTFSGYNLELRYDSGQVRYFLSYPSSNRGKSIVIGQSTYLKQ